MYHHPTHTSHFLEASGFRITSFFFFFSFFLVKALLALLRWISAKYAFIYLLASHLACGIELLVLAQQGEQGALTTEPPPENSLSKMFKGKQQELCPLVSIPPSSLLY